jgi:uncharacterized protein
VLVSGPMGAGKTTAITALSDIETVRTEAVNTDLAASNKPTTTVALDYGEIELGENEVVRLYGTPGQHRFDFMWSILKERAAGLILLVNNDGDDPILTMLEYLDIFNDLYARGGIVVGITRSEFAPLPTVSDYALALAQHRPGQLLPLFTVDPRRRDQLSQVLMSLVINMEMRERFTEQEAVGA